MSRGKLAAPVTSAWLAALVFVVVACAPGLVGADTGGLITDDNTAFLGVTYAQPTSDTTYTITVSGMTGVGVPSTVQYTVTVIDPAATGSPPVTTVDVIEFYNATLDHYFISIDGQEIHDLDTGVHPGWARSGLSFEAYAVVTAGANPVCRFYIPPGYSDSHFFSAAPDECTQTHAKFPQLEYEAPNVFYIALPDTVTGVCPAGTRAVYRLWNQRSDPNHRYTTNLTVATQMINAGYLAEGYGPNAVIMCAVSVGLVGDLGASRRL